MTYKFKRKYTANGNLIKADFKRRITKEDLFIKIFSVIILCIMLVLLAFPMFYWVKRI